MNNRLYGIGYTVNNQLAFILGLRFIIFIHNFKIQVRRNITDNSISISSIIFRWFIGIELMRNKTDNYENS
jgi:hypothetical protein